MYYIQIVAWELGDQTLPIHMKNLSREKVLKEKFLSVLSVFHDCTINGTYVTA